MTETPAPYERQNSNLFPEVRPRVSIEAQIECVERELAMRNRVYPRLVDAGKMSQRQADKEIEAMQAVVETLKACKT